MFLAIQAKPFQKDRHISEQKATQMATMHIYQWFSLLADATVK